MLAFLAFVPVFAFLDENLEIVARLIICSVFGILIFIFLWMFFNTKYIIEQENINYLSGPFRGKIDINSIRKIEYHKGFYIPVIWKIGLDINGLIITYNKFDDIYFSPKNANEFVNEILKINPTIEIKNP